MAQESKIWNKIKNKPNRNDIRMFEVDKLLLFLGFENNTQSGSHRKYYNKEIEEIFIIPCRNDTDCPKGIYIKKIFDIVIENDLSCILEKKGD